jgi:hypothetical protein
MSPTLEIVLLVFGRVFDLFSTLMQKLSSLILALKFYFLFLIKLAHSYDRQVIPILSSSSAITIILHISINYLLNSLLKVKLLFICMLG